MFSGTEVVFSLENQHLSVGTI